MVADMEVHMVADMEVHMVADMGVDKVADNFVWADMEWLTDTFLKKHSICRPMGWEIIVFRQNFSLFDWLDPKIYSPYYSRMSVYSRWEHNDTLYTK